jgi:DHA2 family multidrug resistance protein-like MFS transporter
VVSHPQPVPRTSWSAVTALGVAVFMAAIDLTIVAVALPAMGASFSVGPAQAQWVILAYNLPMIALMLPAGRWVDGVNRRSAFVVAVVGFAGASALAGAAPTFQLLLAARALQGGFGALISALVLAIAAAVVHPSQRGRAMGAIATLGPLGAVAGPGLGGLLVAGPGWRWIFYLNLPVCAVATLIARRSIPSQGRLSALPVSLLGDAVLTAAAALGLLLALDRSRDGGWARPAPLLLLLLAVLAVAGWSRLSTARPVLQALRERALSGQLIALVLAATMAGAAYFLTPFVLEGMLGQSPSEAGAVLLAMPLAMAVASQLGGRTADWVGPRAAATMGGALILAGGLLLVPLDPHWDGPDVAWRLALLGLGNGFFAGPNQSAIMTATPPTLIGTVSALSALGRSLGFALGPAIAVGLWTGRQFTPQAMRPAFLLVAALPVLALLAVLATPRRGVPVSPVAAPSHRTTTRQPPAPSGPTQGSPAQRQQLVADEIEDHEVRLRSGDGVPTSTQEPDPGSSTAG